MVTVTLRPYVVKMNVEMVCYDIQVLGEAKFRTILARNRIHVHDIPVDFFHVTACRNETVIKVFFIYIA
jgi:hypothetical protein